MLTDDELLHIVTDCPAGSPRQLLLQVARGIEAKVLAKMHLAYDQGKTCRTCEHLDTDAKQDPCAGCRDFARWVGKPGAARTDGVRVRGVDEPLPPEVLVGALQDRAHEPGEVTPSTRSRARIAGVSAAPDHTFSQHTPTPGREPQR